MNCEAVENRRHAGLHLQNIRKRRGFTQKELADKVGLTREAIASYESGRSHILDTMLVDLSSVLRVSADEILGLKRTENTETAINRRWAKRIAILDSLPESVRKHILRTLDDLIKANTSLTIFDDS
ncbi:MAG: helix-turn-helix domain-containing protein [Spirochaetaceae bacterium]|jgi:transcriptional regulator with XRE-family HTH domain|nr:helix-turn-helix domain-containing protein [Spirochaetaceae bacterium]